MRKLLAVAVVLTGAVMAFAQPNKPEPRYGMPAQAEVYSQATAKDALASVVKALENKRYEYLLAHLIDPAVADARIADRAKILEPEVDKELAALRVDQRKSPQNYAREDRLPNEPDLFAERVRAEATRRAFKLVVKDLAENLNEFPEHTKQLRAILLDEKALVATGETASGTTADAGGKTVYLKLVGKRWYVEDRQKDEKPKADK